VKLHELWRNEDVSGVSGTGPVAEVVEFESGWVAVSFYSFTASVPNVIVYGSLDDALKIHGHAGRSMLIERPSPGEFTGQEGWEPADRIPGLP
jgi:hypothetical protein